jgi:hypothetical protein
MTGDRAENLGDHKAPRTVSRLRDESDAAVSSGASSGDTILNY